MYINQKRTKGGKKMGWLIDRLERAGKMTEEELMACDPGDEEIIEEEEEKDI